MRYEIKGDTLPVVICHLEAGERMITEREWTDRICIQLSGFDQGI